LTISSQVALRDAGRADPLDPEARQHDIADLPAEVLPYLLGSRYCETDRMADLAWHLFGETQPGWARVQAICDFVHRHLTFNLHQANPRRTALQAYRDRVGVSRDFAHLAISFCRCLNIPARYCTGYLGSIGEPAGQDPLDFGTWFGAWLGGRWHTFDPRHNRPRVGRILMATGRDATDVAFCTTFGQGELTAFEVVTEQFPTPARLVRFPETGPALRLALPETPRRRAAHRRFVLR
jgi:transglutaminase-like putative cysteine protease